MVSLDSPLRGCAEQYLSLLGRYKRWRPAHIGDGGYGAARCTPRLPQCPASGDTDRGESYVRHHQKDRSSPCSVDPVCVRSISVQPDDADCAVSALAESCIRRRGEQRLSFLAQRYCRADGSTC